MEELCSIAATVLIVGKKRTLLALHETFSDVTWFDKLLRRTGCSSAILSLQLRALVTYDILRRVPYQESGDHVRDAYRLVRVDIDLLPVIVAFMQWGDCYLTPDDKDPTLLHDRESGTPIHVALVNTLGEPIASKNSIRERGLHYGRGKNHAATAADTPPAGG